MKHLSTALAGLCIGSLTACSSFLSSPILSPLQADGYITTTGVNQLFSEDQVEQIDLPTLLSADATDELKVSIQASSKHAPNQALLKAFSAFYTVKEPAHKLRRNRIQDTIKMAADARCGTYLKYLSRVEKTQSQFFDGTSTLLSGFGTVARVASTGQLLSGLSTMTKGVGAELRHSYFGSLGADVIAPAIEVARADRWAKLEEWRKKEISDYTVEAAVADAIRYHNSCTMNEGLEKAKALVQSASAVTPKASEPQSPSGGASDPSARPIN